MTLTEVNPVRMTRTVEETLPILGVSRPTLYKLINDGQLRSIKVGRKILIPLSAIDEFLNGGK